MLKKTFKKRIHEILEKYNNRTILINDETANFFGQESLGVWKVRGNGVLILTDEELFFEMWKPKKEISIPIKSIIEITNPKSHMHRSVLRLLLKIIFKNKNGEFDSVAWHVHNLDQWNEILSKLINKN